MSTHYRRLIRPVYLAGLMRWRRCALALHRAGLALHSGTIPVERQWCHYSSFWPVQTRQVTETTFELLSQLCFLRFNWCHFNKPWRPSWTHGDVLLQQRAAEMISMLRSADQGGTTPIEHELVEAYLASAAADGPPRKRQRCCSGNTATV